MTDGFRDVGGSAFPVAAGTVTDMEIDYGMTLRDCFAAQALSGYLSGPLVEDGNTSDVIANHCYMMADAMLEARK